MTGARTSDWSGSHVVGELEEVTVQLPSGERRTLRVSSDDLAVIASRGQDAAPRRPSRDRARHAIVKVAAFLAALLLTAVVTAQVGKVYAQRQQATEIKADLVESINSRSVTAYSRAIAVVSAAVERKSDVRLARARNQAIVNWLEQSSVVDGKIFAHFDGTPAQVDWRKFQRAVFDLTALAHLNPFTDPSPIVRRLQAYVAASKTAPNQAVRPAFDYLLCRTRGCNRTPEWVRAYRIVGDLVLRERRTVMTSFLRGRTQNLD